MVGLLHVSNETTAKRLVNGHVRKNYSNMKPPYKRHLDFLGQFCALPLTHTQKCFGPIYFVLQWSCKCLQQPPAHTSWINPVPHRVSSWLPFWSSGYPQDPSARCLNAFWKLMSYLTFVEICHLFFGDIKTRVFRCWHSFAGFTHGQKSLYFGVARLKVSLSWNNKR